MRILTLIAVIFSFNLALACNQAKEDFTAVDFTQKHLTLSNGSVIDLAFNAKIPTTEWAAFLGKTDDNIQNQVFARLSQLDLSKMAEPGQIEELKIALSEALIKSGFSSVNGIEIARFVVRNPS